MTAYTTPDSEIHYRITLRLLGCIFMQRRSACDLAEKLGFVSETDLVPYLAELSARGWIQPRIVTQPHKLDKSHMPALRIRLNTIQSEASLLPRLMDRSRLWYDFFTEMAGAASAWLWQGSLQFITTPSGERVLDQETWNLELMTGPRPRREPGSASGEA